MENLYNKWARDVKMSIEQIVSIYNSEPGDRFEFV